MTLPNRQAHADLFKSLYLGASVFALERAQVWTFAAEQDHFWYLRACQWGNNSV